LEVLEERSWSFLGEDFGLVASAWQGGNLPRYDGLSGGENDWSCRLCQQEWTPVNRRPSIWKVSYFHSGHRFPPLCQTAERGEMGDFPHRDYKNRRGPLYLVKIQKGTGKSILHEAKNSAAQKSKPIIRMGTGFLAFFKPLLLMRNQCFPAQKAEKTISERAR
jgi:hypothetical protein